MQNQVKLKFDPKKPFATIIGHAWARFEQDGILYDYQGRASGQVEAAVEPEVEVTTTATEGKVEWRDLELENAKQFLKTVLAGGPITKNAIYKECENNNQKWEKVQEAFTELGGAKVRNGNWTLWKLPVEEV